MFPIPDHYTKFRLMAVDPGLNNIGTAIFDIDLEPKPKITRIVAETLKSDRVSRVCDYDSDLVDDAFIRKQNMISATLLLCRQYRPDIFVIESPFFDRNRPSSFAILSEIMFGLFSGVLEIDPNTVLQKYAPQYIKAVLGVAGIKGKEVVKEALSGVEVVTSVLTPDVSVLDEHSIDAAAIGYTYLVRELKLELTGGKP